MVFFDNASLRTMEIVAEVIEIEGNCLQVALMVSRGVSFSKGPFSGSHGGFPVCNRLHCLAPGRATCLGELF